MKSEISLLSWDTGTLKVAGAVVHYFAALYTLMNRYSYSLSVDITMMMPKKASYGHFVHIVGYHSNSTTSQP